MGEVLDFIYICMALGIPFLFGLAAGLGARVGWKRPDSLEHRFGTLIKGDVQDIIDQRKWVGRWGEISRTRRLELEDGRNIEIIVREVA